jgi:hypothetical protein
MAMRILRVFDTPLVLDNVLANMMSHLGKPEYLAANKTRNLRLSRQFWMRLKVLRKVLHSERRVSCDLLALRQQLFRITHPQDRGMAAHPHSRSLVAS